MDFSSYFGGGGGGGMGGGGSSDGPLSSSATSGASFGSGDKTELYALIAVGVLMLFAVILAIKK